MKTETIPTRGALAALAAFTIALAAVPVASAATLYWGGGSNDIADNTAVPANITANGVWSAGGTTPENWASAPGSPNTYSVWTNGQNIADLGTSDATITITVSNNIEAGGLALRQTSAGVRVVTLTDGGSNRTLTFSGTNPVLDISDARAGGESYLGIAGTLQIVAANGTLTIGGGDGTNSARGGGTLGFVGSATSATHDVDTYNLIGRGSAAGPENVTGGLTFAGVTANSVKDTATINVVGGGRIRADRSETIGTLNFSNNYAEIVANTAAGQVFQMSNFNRGSVGTVRFSNLEDPDARVRITGSGEPTNNVTLPWAVNLVQSTNAAFVKYDSVNDTFARVANTLAVSNVSTWAGTHNNTQDVAFFLTTAGGGLTGALTNNLEVNTFLFAASAITLGNTDLNLGGYTLTTKAIALGGQGGGGSTIAITNGNILAAASEDALYIHGGFPTRPISATIGKTGAADNTFDVVLSIQGTANPQVLSGTNEYVGTMFVDGAVTFQRSAASGDVVTGDLVLRPGAEVLLAGSEQINNNSVVTVGAGARIGRAGNDGFTETIRGLEGSGLVRLGESGANNKTLTISTVGGDDFTFSGSISGVDTDAGSSVTKTGSGTQTFSGTNTYDQNTIISGGTLLIDGAHTNSTAGRGYTVTNTGTLGGSGFISLSNGNVRVESGGKLSPGSSPGTLRMSLGTGELNISNSIAAAGTSNLIFELGAPGGSDSDQLVLVTGFFNIGGGLLEFDDFLFSTNAGFVGGTYTLFDTTEDIMGSLGAVTNGFIAGFESYLWFGDTGNDLLLTVVIPEPGAIGLVLLGLGGIALARRRRG